MSHVISEIDGAIAIITLNRPEKHNAFDEALIADLTEHLKALDQHDAVRVVVLSANGKSFSAGADLHWMKRVADYTEAENTRDAMALATLMQTLHSLSKPTIARVQGAAYGGGVGLIACCDIAVGSSNAAFALSETRLGLIPAVISPYVIAAIGARAAQRYFLTGERFDAGEAYRLGLLSELCNNDDDMDLKIEQIIAALFACGPDALAEAKKLIDAVANQPLTNNLITGTAERLARARVSAEGQEGLRAFLEKRNPAWTINKQESK